MCPILSIQHVESGAELEVIRRLLLEYQSQLGIDLGFQGFQMELQALPGDYARPRGRLLLALSGTEPLGCVALREIRDSCCEMKRLFVRPSKRGLGAGKALVSRVLAEAQAIGYSEVVLDTLPSMAEAQIIYERFGFRDIPPYRPNPVPGARYLGLMLRPA